MAGGEHVPLEVGGEVGGLVTIEPVAGTYAAGRIVPEGIRGGNERTRLTDLEHQTAPDHERSLVEPTCARPAETGCDQDTPTNHPTRPGIGSDDATSRGASLGPLNPSS